MNNGWNPWHGCHKISAGCAHCYVYRIDSRHGKDSSRVALTSAYDLPVRRKRNGSYLLAPGSTVYTCFSSDFLVEEADPWRPGAWEMMRERSDLHFFLTTKRIDRLEKVLPTDWGQGYENVTICCTVENQDRANYRLPIYREAPIRHKQLLLEPLLGPIDLTPWLGPWAEEVGVGGESGPQARPCHFVWVVDLRRQCVECGVRFRFHQTGALLVKEGRLYRIPRPLQRIQARKAGIDYK